MESLSSVASEFGRKIRLERDAANLTQTELALELGVSARSIQDWEAGRAFPQPRMRRRIAEFFSQAEEAA